MAGGLPGDCPCGHRQLAYSSSAISSVTGSIEPLTGFAPVAWAGIAPLLTILAILIHANVDWDWGPLRSVIASPRFHRWHHTREDEGLDKNFAGLLPLWDIYSGLTICRRRKFRRYLARTRRCRPDLLGKSCFRFAAANR